MNSPLTAELFDRERHELPDGGRGAELIAGAVHCLEAPDLPHGTAVMNLSKALARFAPRSESGYACFELGVIVERRPDTVYCPAISWFDKGPRFAEVDKTLTEATPEMVTEVVSTNSRRRGLNERILVWHRHGVGVVWVIDPIEKRLHVASRGRPVRTLGEDVLRGEGSLDGFEMNVQTLFETPEWWGKG